MNPADLAALVGALLVLLLFGGLVLCMLRSLDRHDRYRQANANRHLLLDSPREML